MTITIDRVIDRIDAWSGSTATATPLAGGLTNLIYRVDVDGRSYVVRIPGQGTEWLAVDRGNELHNSLAASEAGVAPNVVHHLKDWNVLVLDYIPSETMTIESLKRPGMPAKVAAILRQLHAGPRFLHDFDMFELTRRYLRICRDQGFPIPDGYLDGLPQVARIEETFRARPIAKVPCHNDLLAGNILDDGRRLWLIDFEYSGNNDPTFELGNTCQEQEYDDGQVAEVCASYFGSAREDMLARMKLNMIMSDVGWSLWAAISARISEIDYDFWGWALDRWSRARTKLDSNEFPQLLASL